MYTKIETVSYFCVSLEKICIFQYIFLILGTYHPDILYLCEQGCEDPWIFYEAKRGPRAKTFGQHWENGRIYRPITR
jgi:hypothetical protein